MTFIHISIFFFLLELSSRSIPKYFCFSLLCIGRVSAKWQRERDRETNNNNTNMLNDRFCLIFHQFYFSFNRFVSDRMPPLSLLQPFAVNDCITVDISWQLCIFQAWKFHLKFYSLLVADKCIKSRAFH